MPTVRSRGIAGTSGPFAPPLAPGLRVELRHVVANVRAEGVARDEAAFLPSLQSTNS